MPLQGRTLASFIGMLPSFVHTVPGLPPFCILQASKFALGGHIILFCLPQLLAKAEECINLLSARLGTDSYFSGERYWVVLSESMVLYSSMCSWDSLPLRWYNHKHTGGWCFTCSSASQWELHCECMMASWHPQASITQHITLSSTMVTT